MSGKSTRKGKVFEREIAAMLRKQWPSALVRRASQAERADNPDVFVTGHPLLERLWLELQDARHPTPIAKLVQAERDCDRVADYPSAQRYPVAIWHELGARTIHVTTRLWVVDAIRKRSLVVIDQHPVTIALPSFLDLLQAAPR